MEASPPRSRRRWPWVVASVPVVLLILAWSLTADLDAPSTASLPKAAAPVPRTPTAEKAATWPESTLEGEPAKRFLLAYLEAAKARLAGVSGYTATFRKRERIRGILGAEQTIAMKVWHRPFSIYFKYLAPTAGREVLYVAGKHDDKMIVHSGDFAGRLLPRVPVDPKGPIALADNRHPITEVGLANLTDRLISFRRLDLDDPDAETVLDRIIDDRGRAWNRSVHIHHERTPARPFRRVEVLYDPSTNLPHRIASDDWPEAGEAAGPKLAEMYSYDDVKLDAPLAEIDFDLSNPAYAFRRF